MKKLKVLAWLPKKWHYPITRKGRGALGSTSSRDHHLRHPSPLATASNGCRSYSHCHQIPILPRLRFASCHQSVNSQSIFKYADFNTPALCLWVGELRGGQPCFCYTSQVPACGSFNWKILISFSDGVEWVLRFPTR